MKRCLVRAFYSLMIITAVTGDYPESRALAQSSTSTSSLSRPPDPATPSKAEKHYLNAARYQSRKHYTRAIEEYRYALKADSGNPTYRFGLASCFAASKQYGKSLKILNNLQKTHSQDAALQKLYNQVRNCLANNYAAKGMNYARLKQYGKAIQQLKAALSFVPSDQPAAQPILFNLGLAQFKSNLFKEAHSTFNRVYKNNPSKSVDSLVYIAKIEENSDRGERARFLYAKYLKERPGGRFDKFCRRRLAVLSKDPKATEKIADSISSGTNLFNNKKSIATLLEADKKNPTAKSAFILGFAYQKKENNPPAIKYYKIALKRNPSAKLRSIISKELAYLLEEDSHTLKSKLSYEEIVANLKLAINLAPDNPLYSYRLGHTYHLHNNLQPAIKNYKLALKKNPDSELRQKIELNLGLLTKYKSSNPKDAKTLAIEAYNRGVDLQNAGASKFAIPKFKKAFKLDPSNSSYAFALAAAYHADKDLKNAKTYYIKAKELNPDPAGKKAIEITIKRINSAEAEKFIVAAFKKQTTKNLEGKYDIAGAIADYQKALTLSDTPKTRVNLGSAYQQQKQNKKALEQYSKAILMDPDFVDAYYFRATAYDNLLQKENAIADYKTFLEKRPSGQNTEHARSRLKSLEN